VFPAIENMRPEAMENLVEAIEEILSMVKSEKQ
jgi:hypothetical protein